ncbi:glutathione S-transferase-like [Branchiostoma floridae]|uniref:glutathione transferase n=1 Tax=Branchiostoma floridae TaxID=7739 RepID=A0A9J7KX63_BRAFL|nr:glutathione S-transferase-like [Branchiostoma floridae]
MGCGASSSAQTAPAAKPQARNNMAPSAPPKVKLTYFDFRGRAEPIRLLLEAGGVKYEFNGISQEEWKNLKPMAITGGLPILEINDKPLGESLAIGRFVARKNDMTGADDFDAACCDMIVDNVNEIFFSKMAPVMFMPEEERPAALKKLVEEYMPAKFAILQKFADKNNNGHFVGNKLTWADVYFFSIFDLMKAHLPEEAFEMIKGKFVAPCPSFQKIIHTVKSNPGIAAYLKNREPPVTDA